MGDIKRTRHLQINSKALGTSTPLQSPNILLIANAQYTMRKSESPQPGVVENLCTITFTNNAQPAPTPTPYVNVAQSRNEGVKKTRTLHPHPDMPSRIAPILPYPADRTSREGWRAIGGLHRSLLGSEGCGPCMWAVAPRHVRGMSYTRK